MNRNGYHISKVLYDFHSIRKGNSMITICIRLTIIYLVTLICMRIMGKRQIGELELSELVTAIFISELTTNPITDPNTPLLYGIIPTLLLLCFEVLLSFLSVKSNFFKNLLGKNPTFLIEKGKINQKGMEKVRITVNELLTQLRMKDVPDPSQVNYAVLEPNGEISVILKADRQPLCPADLELPSDENGIHHLLISDGAINRTSLGAVGKDEAWLEKQLAERKLTPKEVFFMSVDDASNIFIVKKEPK